MSSLQSYFLCCLSVPLPVKCPIEKLNIQWRDICEWKAFLRSNTYSKKNQPGIWVLLFHCPDCCPWIWSPMSTQLYASQSRLTAVTNDSQASVGYPDEVYSLCTFQTNANRQRGGLALSSPSSPTLTMFRTWFSRLLWGLASRWQKGKRVSGCGGEPGGK